LHACEADGLTLALSVAGGGRGERALPLLVTDADWDAVADRLHGVLRDGRNEELVRLLDVVESALTTAPDEHAEAELVALAEHAVELAGRRLDDLAPPAPIDLLVGWLALAGAVGQAEVHPAVTAAWIELVPTEHSDLGDPEERARAETWRRLARAVRHYS